MFRFPRTAYFGFIAAAFILGLTGCKREGWQAPVAVIVAKDGGMVWMVCEKGRCAVAIDPQGGVKWSTQLPGEATGLTVSKEGELLAVTCAQAPSCVVLLDAEGGRERARHVVGHSVTAPVFSADGRTLYVCDRFRNEVLWVDVANGSVTKTVAVPREPVAAALTPEGGHLVVANHLQEGDGVGEYVAASLAIIDIRHGQACRLVKLPNGSGLLQGVAVSPDGARVAVTHNLARFKLPTTQVERGWICSAAVSLVELRSDKAPKTILLDNVDAGAANPWAVAWAGEGSTLIVSHAGTHEISIIDYAALSKKLESQSNAEEDARAASATDLSFLLGMRRRVPLMGNGPRAMAVHGTTIWVAGYFSDTLERLDTVGSGTTVVWAPKPPMPMTREQRGERAFNDARHCFQGWLSCASCHSSTGRVDGLNWDLLNDGIGNPKNAKSLLYSHRTPPTMSTGVRATAEAAVRAGFRHIQFAEPAVGVMEDVDAYLSSLKAVPSPQLEKGRLSAAAKRGEALFNDPKVGCAICHSGEYYTDLNSYDVGTAGRYDPKGTALDTPTLREVWRTAPYLHDGSAATLKDVFTKRNEGNRHGATMHLTPTQIDDLCAFVLSL